jgi:hypothetical protein
MTSFFRGALAWALPIEEVPTLLVVADRRVRAKAKAHEMEQSGKKAPG